MTRSVMGPSSKHGEEDDLFRPACAGRRTRATWVARAGRHRAAAATCSGGRAVAVVATTMIPRPKTITTHETRARLDTVAVCLRPNQSAKFEQQFVWRSNGQIVPLVAHPPAGWHRVGVTTVAVCRGGHEALSPESTLRSRGSRAIVVHRRRQVAAFLTPSLLFAS